MAYMYHAHSFAAASRAWCLHEAMKLALIPGDPYWKGLCWLLVMAAAARPAPQTVMLALLVRVTDTLSLMPIMWDSYYWCLQLDGGLLVALAHLSIGRRALQLADTAALAEWWANTARVQLSLFYLASGFWKINSSFFEPATSCAPIFVLTLLSSLGFVPPPELAALIAKSAPTVTILGEFSIGVLLLGGSSKPRLARCGVALALFLHLGIALTPPPNNATPFSLTCAVRLLVTQSSGVAMALDELCAAFTSKRKSAAGLWTATIAVGAGAVSASVVYARMAAFPPAPRVVAELDW